MTAHAPSGLRGIFARKPTTLLFAALLFGAQLAGAAALTACGEDEPLNPCAGGRCGCTSGYGCRLLCDRPNCDVSCQSNEQCELACGDGCVAQATSVKQYAASCGADCAVGCTSVESCTGGCGDRCDVSCTNTKLCDLAVGAGATVRCESVERCAIRCAGACTVKCQNVQQGGCQVRCADGATAPVVGDQASCAL